MLNETKANRSKDIRWPNGGDVNRVVKMGGLLSKRCSKCKGRWSNECR